MFRTATWQMCCLSSQPLFADRLFRVICRMTQDATGARFALSFVICVWKINILNKRTLIEFYDIKLFLSRCAPYFLSLGWFRREKEENGVAKPKQSSDASWSNGMWQHQTSWQAQASHSFLVPAWTTVLLLERSS